MEQQGCRQRQGIRWRRNSPPPVGPPFGHCRPPEGRAGLFTPPSPPSLPAKPIPPPPPHRAWQLTPYGTLLDGSYALEQTATHERGGGEGVDSIIGWEDEDKLPLRSPPLHPSMMYFVFWRPTLVVKIIYTQANKTSKVHTQKMPLQHVCVIAVVFCWA